jgi:hypothetical protein
MRRMTRKARIAAALSAPVIGSLAFLGLAMGPAAPAGAASPIQINGSNIIITIPPILYLNLAL